MAVHIEVDSLCWVGIGVLSASGWGTPPNRTALPPNPAFTRVT